MQKVILVDDHQIVRKGIRHLLEDASADLEVVAEAASAQELFDLLPHTQADIILLDLGLPGMDGLAATSYLKAHYPELKVLVLSMMDQEQHVAKAMAAGAEGYLFKSSNQDELIQALQLVASGNKYITPQLSLKLLQKEEPVSLSSAQYQVLARADVLAREAPVRTEVAARPETLSKREIEVLKLIAEGYTAEKIADKIFTSKRTVETHRQNMLEKTKSRNTANLIVYAHRHHLLD